MEPARCILIVEDSRTQALQLSSVLERAGWQTMHAMSAEQAIEMMAQRTPDLILIDYYLPGIRGDELCRQIRSRIDMRIVPIVILTGDAGHQVELQGLESGATDFIAKSADEEVLLVRLRALLAKAHVSSPLPATPPDSAFQNARLLAIDDSRTYLAYLVSELSAAGYRTETASCGTEALERLSREDFDCVLVDLVMPEMDGIEVCKRINELRSASRKNVMVLMLTAKEDNQSLAQALEAGADDFVGKSSDIIVVKGRVRALLRRKFYEEEHHRRLSAELRAKELEAEHARLQKETAEARAALVDDLQKTAEALRRSNSELQQFAYVASHDLQEPLRVIASYVELIARRYKDKLDAEAGEFIHYVVDAAVRMKRLISDLLAYSRIESRGESLQMVDMSAVLNDTLNNLKSTIDDRAAEITNDPLPVVRGDRSQLMQLLQNLIGNAIKYSGDRAPRIHVGAVLNGDVWNFHVLDHGIGIKAEYFERIFVIFQRLHRQNEYPGTGIGLAIAKRIVERHGGRIWVTSTPGEGATFWFTLSSSTSPPTSVADCRTTATESRVVPA